MIDDDKKADRTQQATDEIAAESTADTLVAQALGWRDPINNGIAPALHPSTNYARDENYEKTAGRTYTRDDNPTYDQPEALLRTLEGGTDALLFASGMAAATTAFWALQPGDHVVAPTIMYFGFVKWLEDVARPWGLEVDLVPPGDLDALARAVRPGATKLVWLETPCNPIWTVTDIQAAAEIAHDAGAKLAVDSTAASPILTRPLALGADLVMHSATKYLNGHGDVLAGALVTRTPVDDPWWQRIRYLRYQNGAMLGTFEAWLLLRGMRTLALRVRRASASALAIAHHFEGHAKILEVLYPGLESHPGHDVAARQMQGGFGGMLSIRVTGGPVAAIKLAVSTKLFAPATSLGGIESLIEHRATVEGGTTDVPEDMLRLSVGIEDPRELIADLEQALSLIGTTG